MGDDEQQAIEDHDKKLQRLLVRCSEQELRQNNEKTELRKDEISFLGNKISKDGLKPDPMKVEAIAKMKPPTDVT